MHDAELKRLRERYESHLSEASARVKEVQDANRSAIALLRRMKRLEKENERLLRSLGETQVGGRGGVTIAAVVIGPQRVSAPPHPHSGGTARGGRAGAAEGG